MEFIREHFQSVNTQTILSNQTEHYELFHINYSWQNQSLCNRLFCSENVEDLGAHSIEGSEKAGNSDAPRLSMDNVKSLFCF